MPEAVATMWRLWKAGIVRENYALADHPGVAIGFELPSVEGARRYTEMFPLPRAGYLEWFFFPLTVLLLLETLFAQSVDAHAVRSYL